MKKLFTLLLASILLFSCKKEKTTNEYVINGTLKNIPDNSLIIISINNKHIDSARVVNGKFTFTGSVDKPKNVFLKIDQTRNQKAFWLENSVISFTAEQGKFRQATIKGSKLQDESDELRRRITPHDKLEDEINDYAEKNQEKLSQKQMDSLFAAYTKAEQAGYNEIMKFVREKPASKISLYQLNFYKTTFKRKDVKELYALLSDDSKNEKAGIEIAEYLEKREIKVGNQYEDFTLKNTKGKEVALSSTVKNSKYTLLEFWGSWCGPCRKYNPTLVKTYTKYKSKGFEIFGIAQEASKEDWLKAIKNDGLTWENVIDLKTSSSKSDVEMQYSINIHPTSFLIDNQGKVIAKNLSMEELDDKLSELLFP